MRVNKCTELRPVALVALISVDVDLCINSYCMFVCVVEGF